MTKPTIVKRATKGTPLTYEELDANFENLDNATITLQAGTGGTDVVSDLNGKITLVAGTNITLAGDNTAKTLTISSSGSGSGITDVVQDTSPQLGGNLDVNGKQIVSVSNGNISLVPDGSGNIQLTPSTGHVTISATNFPTGTGTSGQALVTDGAGQASWASVGSGTVASGNSGKLAYYNSSGTRVDSSNVSVSDVGSVTTVSLGSSTNSLKVGTSTSNTTFGYSGYHTVATNLHTINSTGAISLNAEYSTTPVDIQMSSGVMNLNSSYGIIANSAITTTANTGNSFFAIKRLNSRNTGFDTSVAMDNLNVRVHGMGGSAGQLQVSAVSGTMNTFITTFGNVAGQSVAGDTSSSGITLTAGTWTSSGFRYNISSGGDVIEAHVQDQTNDRIYRITAMHGSSTTGAFVSIERLL